MILPLLNRLNFKRSSLATAGAIFPSEILNFKAFEVSKNSSAHELKDPNGKD